jgi:hypothetical protein
MVIVAFLGTACPELSSFRFPDELVNCTGLRYRKAGRRMFLDSEVLTDPPGMAVYKDTIQKWDLGHTFLIFFGNKETASVRGED